MKRHQPKLMNITFIILLYILTAAFFVYGLYIVKCNLDYINSYPNNSYITNHNILQYITESSMIYFATGLITLLGAVILTTINRLQRNICNTILNMNNNHITSSYDHNNYSYINDDQLLETKKQNQSS